MSLSASTSSTPNPPFASASASTSTPSPQRLRCAKTPCQRQRNTVCVQLWCKPCCIQSSIPCSAPLHRQEARLRAFSRRLRARNCWKGPVRAGAAGLCRTGLPEGVVAGIARADVVRMGAARDRLRSTQRRLVATMSLCASLIFVFALTTHPLVPRTHLPRTFPARIHRRHPYELRLHELHVPLCSSNPFRCFLARSLCSE
ncbi:hypothetical protein C8R47DRAFT_499492 [Mycena vitilis]|nr:hypothetical protein C8R47DRAFT_499492 [Mycena vitilis]